MLPPSPGFSVVPDLPHPAARKPAVPSRWRGGAALFVAVMAALLCGCTDTTESPVAGSDAGAAPGDQGSAATDSVPAGIALLNQHRQAVGVPAVELDEALTKGCREHVRYMAATGKIAHEQDSSNPYYSPAGNKAAENSVLAYQVAGLGDAVDKWMWSLYHRLRLIDPGLTAVGAAYEYDYACLDVLSAYQPMEKHAPLPYPAQGQTGVPVRYPDVIGVSPIPPDLHPPVGPAISLLFQPESVLAADFTVALLVEGTGTGADLFVRLPKDPSDPHAAYQGNAVAALPTTPLAPGTTYRVVMKGSVDEKLFEKQWVFVTAP